MANILPNAADRELTLLEKVEKEIRRHERRERIHQIIMGGLALLAVGMFFTGKCCGHHHGCHHKL